MGKYWQAQIKKMEEDLMEIGVKIHSQKSIKKLLEGKDKTITYLKKQLKIPIVDHPQTK